MAIRTTASLMCLLVATQALRAQAAVPEPWRDWSRIAGLQPGRAVTIETRQPKAKRSGSFVSSDEAGVTIELRGGNSETIARENVAAVTARRERHAYAPLAGAAAGPVIYVLAAPSSDIVPTGHLVFGGVCAAIGALTGWGIRALGRSALIYKAPGR